jgi:esterase/lipase
VSGERYAELDNIRQPTLVVNGNHDIMIPTINSYNLSQRIPQSLSGKIKLDCIAFGA